MRKIKNWGDLAPQEDPNVDGVGRDSDAEMEAMEPNLAESLAGDLSSMSNESFVERVNNVNTGGAGEMVDLGDYDSDSDWGGVSIPEPVGDDVDQFNPNRANLDDQGDNMVDMGPLEDDDEQTETQGERNEAEQPGKSGKKKGLFGKKGDKKNKKVKKPKGDKGKHKGVDFKKKGEPNIVEMRSVPSDDFIILEEQGKVKNQIIQMVKYGLLALLFFMGIYLTYFMLSYRMVPEDIKGTEDRFMQFNIISVDYQVSMDEVKPGQILLVSTTPKWCPIIYSYRLLQYESRNGNVIFCINNSGLTERVEYGDVDYVLIGKPRS